MVSRHILRVEAKIVEDGENKKVRRLLWDDKVPGTSAGTRMAAAGFLEESQVDSFLPCQTRRFEQHQDRHGCFKSLGEIKMKWQTHRGSVHPLRLWTLARSSPEKLESRVMPGEGRKVGP